MLLLALSGPALAQEPLTQAVVDRWREELRGPIEAAAGRTFVEVPAVRLAATETVRARWAGRGGLSDRDWETLLAVYAPDTREILLPVDAWRRLVRERLDAALLVPVARCVVAQQLTLTLQHQYDASTWRLEGDSAVVADALARGFADHVAARVCGDGAGWLDLAQGLDVPGSHQPTEPVVFAYVYAESFVRHLEAVAGVEAVWAALFEPPPRALIAEIGGADLPPWREPERLAAAAAALGDPYTTVRSGALSAAEALAPVTPPPRDEGGEHLVTPTLRGMAGLGWQTSLGDHQHGVMAFLLEDPVDAVVWLDHRRESTFWEGGRTLIDVGYRSARGRARAVPTLAQLPGVSGTFRLHLPLAGDWAYEEVWVARGRQLLGAYLVDAGLDPRRLEDAVATLLALDLPEEGPGLDAADVTALRALPRDGPRTPSWEYALWELHGPIARKDWPACVVIAERLLPGLTPEGRRAAAGLAVPCATLAADLGAADRLVTGAGGVTSLPAPAGLKYATRLTEAERWQEVLAALDADAPWLGRWWWPEAPDARAQAASLALRADLALGRWEDARRIVLAGEAPAEDLEAARARLAEHGH